MREQQRGEARVARQAHLLHQFRDPRGELIALGELGVDEHADFHDRLLPFGRSLAAGPRRRTPYPTGGPT